MHNLSCENEFYFDENEKWFPYQRLSTYPRFETEAQGNSEMAYWHHSHPIIVITILGYPPQQTILFVFCYLKHHFLDSCNPLFTGNMSVHTQGSLQKQNESEHE